MSTIKRRFGLDIARAAAILMVFLAHGLTLKDIPILSQFGTGVDLFFVLSGFLIGRIYFQTSVRPDFSIRSFWMARWMRTIPPYLAALALYELARRPYPEVGFAALPFNYVFFVQNYSGIDGFGCTWSLCVEEHFYLALPIVALSLEYLFGRTVYRIALPVAFIAPLVLRGATVLFTGALPTDWYWMTHFHCEGLIAGVWLAYTFVTAPTDFQRLSKPARWLLPLVPVLMLILSLWDTRGPGVNMFIFTLLAIGYTAWVRFLYDVQMPAPSRIGRVIHRVVEFIALSSYSLYLTHTTAFGPLRLAFSGLSRGWVRSGLVLSAAFAIGVVFYFGVERLSLKIRDRLTTGKRTRTQHASVSILEAPSAVIQ
ncbi:MAG: acyltransferase [Planctomycetota bacterium]